MKTFSEYLEAASKKEKDPEDYPFTVYRVVKDYEDEFKYAVKGFNTEKEAEDFVNNEEKHHYGMMNDTFEIREN